MMGTAPARAIAALRRFAHERTDAEWCDVCTAPLRSVHGHLLETATRTLRCACPACAGLLADTPGARWRRVSHRVTKLVGVRLTDEDWAAVGAPVDLAFFVQVGASHRVVMRYPSPGGPVEAMVEPAAWGTVVAANPALSDLRADVEALLVNRTATRREYYVVSIDECYRLVGLLRRHWRGFSGGPEVQERIAEFFASLDDVGGAL